MDAQPSLGIGKLLRLAAMVNAAAQTEVMRDSASALVRAYNGLRTELLASVGSHDELRGELERLFPLVNDPGVFNLNADAPSTFVAAASDAQTRLRQLAGWIQGLIDESTLHERLRLDAEAKARQQAKPATGFQPAE